MPTNDLQLLADVVADTLRSPDTLLIRYSVRNLGDDVAELRDFPDFYQFRVFHGNGEEVDPDTYSEQLSNHGLLPMLLAPGASTPVHEVNLACMEYHPHTFRVRYASDYSCQMGFRLVSPGYYFVIVQHIPVAWPEMNGQEFLSSRADTVLFYYEPRL
jgi:hypothetical protein